MISLVRLLLELHLYSPALTVLQVLTTADDEDPEVWYLGGWACFLMMEAKKALPPAPSAESNTHNEPEDDDDNWESWTWEELGAEARERLERCQLVRLLHSVIDLILIVP
jgi:hypothetical protein